MKKIILFLLLIIPFYVNATVEDYYMEATVLNTGDIKVREVFSLDGTYNGFDRELYYGNNIYAGTNIEVINVKGIKKTSNDFNVLNDNGDTFKEVGSASKGDYGYYTITNVSGGISIRIYNPSKKDRLFYIEYIVKNMAIKHNDVGEVGYNIFTSLREPVSNVNVKFIIPNNNKTIKVWGHGPLTGETSIVSQNEVLLKLDYLEAYKGLDIRVVFDKEVLSESLKTDGKDVLDSIIEEETKKADEANKIREEERKKLEQLKEQIELAISEFEKDRTQAKKDYAISLVNQLYGYEEYDIYMHRLNSTLSYEEEAKLKKDKTIGKIINCLCITYLGIGAFIFYKFYNNHDKEYKPLFNHEYYRDFPNNYGPEKVDYLVNGKISSRSFTAMMLNLIYKKQIDFEKLDKNNYKLKMLDKKNLSNSESYLIKCIFGTKDEVTLKEMKNNAKKDYDYFTNNYRSWQLNALSESKAMNFYEPSNKVFNCLYSLLPFLLFYLSYYFQYSNGFLIFITILLAPISLIYYLCASKRSKEGNEEYHKWMALKNFMKDFGRMQEKELPEIKLWEKYLIYATVFGIAKKLAKTMELKVKQFENADFNDIYTINAFHDMLNVSNVVASSVETAKIIADRAYAVAHSSDSSGSGSGGGFSSGGGSFGGGGGGGRF